MMKIDRPGRSGTRSNVSNVYALKDGRYREERSSCVVVFDGTALWMSPRADGPVLRSSAQPTVLDEGRGAEAIIGLADHDHERAETIRPHITPSQGRSPHLRSTSRALRFKSSAPDWRPSAVNICANSRAHSA